MKYYVYALARNNTVFYIGKGSGKRIYAHEAEAARGHRCYKCNTIRKAWRLGEHIHRYILFTTDDEVEALSYEIEMIALHGRHNLTNQSDGGEGIEGRILSPETRAKMSAAQKQRLSDPDTLERHRQSMRRWQQNDPEWHKRARETWLSNLEIFPERRQQMSDRMVMIWKRPGHRERVSTAIRARFSDPVLRKRLREALMEAMTPERRAIISVQSRERWGDPEYRALMIASIVRGSNRPEVIENARRSTAESWKNPTIRTKRVAGLRAYLATPEARAQRSVARRAYLATPEGKLQHRLTAIKTWQDSARRLQAADRTRQSWQNATIRRQRMDAMRIYFDDINTRAKLSERLRKRWSNPLERRKMTKAIKSVWNRPGQRERAADRQRALMSTPERRAQSREVMVQRFSDPAERIKQSERMQQHMQDPERRQRVSANSKAMWANPERRGRLMLSLRQALNMPEYRAAASDRIRKRWQDNEYKQRTSASIRAFYIRPGEREKVRQRIKTMMANPAMRAHLRQTTTDSWNDPDIRARRIAGMKTAIKAWFSDPINRAAHRARLNTPEHRAKARASRLAYLATPEGQSTHLANLQRLNTDPELLARRRTNQRAAMETEEYRAKLSAGVRAHYDNNPEAIVIARKNMNRAFNDPKRIENQRASTQTPEYREKKRAESLARMQDPEYKARWEASIVKRMEGKRERNDQIRELYKQGCTTRDLAQQFRLSISSIQIIVKDLRD